MTNESAFGRFRPLEANLARITGSDSSASIASAWVSPYPQGLRSTLMKPGAVANQ